MDQTPCKCPKLKRDTLPLEPWNSAVSGDDQAVRAWLYNGGDINAATDAGSTLLSAAASYGQFKVLEHLLRFPTLHLNTHHDFEGTVAYTPLWLAAVNGHLGCVESLLQSNLQCRIDLIASKGTELSAVMAAANKSNWDIVNALLDAYQELNQKEAIYIFNSAAKEMKWDTVLSAVSKCTDLRADVLNSLLVEAYEAGEWLVVCIILEKNFRYKYESLNRIFSKTVESRNWERVAQLLQMMKKPTIFDVTLVKAALSEQEEEVEKLLEEVKYDDEILNGSLIVIVAGGTNDHIASLIYKNRYFSSEAQENVLFLSSLNGHLEFLQLIFARKTRHKYSYHSLSRAQQAASEAGHLNVERVLIKILDKELADNFTYNY